MGKKANHNSPSDEAYKAEGRYAKNKERKRLKEEKRKSDKAKQRERRNFDKE